LKLVRAQHFAHEKIIPATVAKFYGAPCQFSSLTNDGLVGIQQARQLDWNLFPTAQRTLDMRSLGHERIQHLGGVSIARLNLSSPLVKARLSTDSSRNFGLCSGHEVPLAYGSSCSLS
jgi:hypothetical protein